MDRREFQEKVHEIAGPDLAKSPGMRTTKIDRQYLEVEWVSGGVTGGNCWGGVADQAVSTDPEPELDDLDDLLSEVSPSLSFLHYRKLKREIQYSERTQPEYYGNYIEYSVKRISVDTVYDMLSDWGYL